LNGCAPRPVATDRAAASREQEPSSPEGSGTGAAVRAVRGPAAAAPLAAPRLPPRARAEPGPAQLYALLGLMLLMWSGNFIFAKLAVRTVPPLVVVCVRTVIAGVLAFPFYLGFGRGPEIRRFGRRDLPRLAAIGVLGIVGNQMLFVLALSRTSVAHGAIVGATGPVMVLLLTASSGQERLTRGKLAGLLAAAAGVIVVQLGKAPAGAPSLAGDLLMLGNAALFAGFSVVGKGAASEFGSLALNAVAFWAGGLLALPYGAWGLWRVGLGNVGLVAWIGIFYIAFTAIAGYAIYSYALRYLPASRVSGITYIQPPLATLMAAAFLGERPGLAFAVGAVAVLGGVWLARR
jgi:drug/metabolite transporter (DMT)-like permease